VKIFALESYNYCEIEVQGVLDPTIQAETH